MLTAWRECRPACAACCIAPSITTAMPGHPNGKPAGEHCANLTEDWRCRLWGRPERPSCCSGLQPSVEMCGDHRQQAIAWLAALEQATRP
ncbi:YkgJ family cysteine cluster protein [Candidatus Accumulibacter phosphatis]|uniref:YkgJ family cysteine cluster protein n=1 Tax=Candidatus Accumulibacter phosphatis TaxID=327160 RepID=UPI00110A6C2A|nr:YkgJ family cysteine cluster protein [Candidatus Accumulibacter phosphatis]